MAIGNIETPAERAERLLPKIDSIFCGTLSGKEADDVIREGESVLRELEQFVEALEGSVTSTEGRELPSGQLRQLIESLSVSITLARKEAS
ncbi:MAG: hypothetical protein HY432_02755 [Candidatus Liptonbacteria bacterium]|nr:hypothetical protein [Candidatus Liptonbacteria bacterium]